MDILQAAQRIVERDETTTSEHKMTPKQLTLLTALKISSIELLAAAIKSQEMSGPEHQEFKNKIISEFFKFLTMRNREVAEVAKKALFQVCIFFRIKCIVFLSNVQTVHLYIFRN